MLRALLAAHAATGADVSCGAEMLVSIVGVKATLCQVHATAKPIQLSTPISTLAPDAKTAVLADGAGQRQAGAGQGRGGPQGTAGRHHKALRAPAEGRESGASSASGGTQVTCVPVRRCELNLRMR